MAARILVAAALAGGCFSSTAPSPPISNATSVGAPASRVAIVLRDDGETLDFRWYYQDGAEGATATLRRTAPR